jgi:hypothetical protein
VLVDQAAIADGAVQIFDRFVVHVLPFRNVLFSQAKIGSAKGPVKSSKANRSKKFIFYAIFALFKLNPL